MNKQTFISWNQYNREQLLDNLRNKIWFNFANLNIDGKLDLIRQNLFVSVAPMIKNVVIQENAMKLSWFDEELKLLKFIATTFGNRSKIMTVGRFM